MAQYYQTLLERARLADYRSDKTAARRYQVRSLVGQGFRLEDIASYLKLDLATAQEDVKSMANKSIFKGTE